jgi:hypothetical protein
MMDGPFPHPGPLHWGEGETFACRLKCGKLGFAVNQIGNLNRSLNHAQLTVSS